MSIEIEKYFQEQYERSKKKVIPKQVPVFKSEKQVDMWFQLINNNFMKKGDKVNDKSYVS